MRLQRRVFQNGLSGLQLILGWFVIVSKHFSHFSQLTDVESRPNQCLAAGETFLYDVDTRPFKIKTTSR